MNDKSYPCRHSWSIEGVPFDGGTAIIAFKYGLSNTPELRPPTKDAFYTWGAYEWWEACLCFRPDTHEMPPKQPFIAMYGKSGRSLQI